MASGLPTNAVYAVCQTRDGYLWIGTGDGLVRFDGLSFEIFNTRKNPQLKSDKIRALHEDSGGKLWIGTDTGGLSYYHGEEFFTFTTAEHKALYRINAINEDNRGNLWIGSLTTGLTCLSSGTFTTYTKKDGLPGNEIYSIYKDGNKDLWVTTPAGIIKIIEPGLFQSRISWEDLPYEKYACLYEEDTGEIWVGTFGHGLFRLKDGQFKSYRYKTGIAYPNINCLFKDRMENLWIGAEREGIIRLSGNLFSSLNYSTGISHGFVSSVYEDREDNLWVGTADRGLLQLRDSKFTTYTGKEGLNHDYIHCVYEDRAGALWFGTEQGLNRLAEGNITDPFPGRKGISNKRISSFFEDSTSTLWIGTDGKGIHRFKDGKLTTLTTADGLSNNTITCISGESRDYTWIGTVQGLNRFSSSDRLSVFTTKDGLSHSFIHFIFEDSRGNLWIGTESGLNILKDRIANTFNPVIKFKDTVFSCAYEDGQGNLWFGTESGLIRMEKEKTTLYNTRCGLIENYVYSVSEDGRGNLWLAGRNGISYVKKKELEDFSQGIIRQVQPESFNEKDGMKSRWCTGMVCKTRDGRFWFPTLRGVSMIDPGNIRKNHVIPESIIEKFIVDDDPVPVGKAVKEGDSITLSPGKERFEFFYTAASFTNPERMKFKLKLEGYDNQWINRGNMRSTTYTSLSPGSYTFRVIACNADGIWNETGSSLSFYLKPFFHQTGWFFLLIVLAAVAGTYSLYRFRVRQLRAREKKLSALVSLRTKDLRERNTELEKARQKIQQSKEIIETKNRHITDSMRYAHKIQQAMLPIKEKMSRELKDYFVIYRPKDIVSGDFYWFDVVDHHYFLAVGDCTGHGIPGALLSMIGYMMLKEVVSEKRIIDPAAVLSHLHLGFRAALKQEEGETDTHDGMDMALCRIDKKAGKVIFAGAGRPLLYVKNSELVRIKGDRKSIGGRQKEEKRFFTNHEIDISGEKEKGIMFFLTTDGFSDQNDARDKKYGSRKLEQFLRQQAHLGPAKLEEALLAELKEHMAGEEQRDDITIIGF